MVAPEYCRVHLWTSLWMLLPMAASHPDYMLLHYSLMAACVASMAHWHWYQHWGVLHALDRVSAAWVVVYLLHTNHLEVSVLVFVGLILFIGGMRAHYKNRSAAACMYHLLFRYFVFWACCVSVQHLSANLFLLYSAGYLLHVKLLLA